MTEPLVVVPLDGSELSERALPYATALAKALGLKLHLASVWEAQEERAELLARGIQVPPNVEDHVADYLRDVAQGIRKQGLAVETAVRSGRAAEEIVHLLEERQARFLVLASHGRSGLSRWWYGSVAGSLVREAPVSTLLIGPRVLKKRGKRILMRRILVPLDGSPLAEAALERAAELAQAFGGEIVLAEVLGWAGQGAVFGVPEVDVGRIDQELTEAAGTYLARARQRLPEQLSVETKVLHGAPAEALSELIRAERIDLVVMTSHTRAGIARAILGSVAERMLQAPAPVLLVRPGA